MQGVQNVIVIVNCSFTVFPLGQSCSSKSEALNICGNRKTVQTYVQSLHHPGTYTADGLAACK